jgi:hypothetical protein
MYTSLTYRSPAEPSAPSRHVSNASAAHGDERTAWRAGLLATGVDPLHPSSPVAAANEVPAMHAPSSSIVLSR